MSVSLASIKESCLQRPAGLWAVLIALFLGSFAVPIAFSSKFLGRYTELHETSGPLREIPIVVDVQTSTTGLQISSSNSIQPLVNQDYLLVAWFRLSQLPLEGRPISLISKFSRTRGGYVVAIKRKGSTIRPVVFYGNSAKGHWHEFVGSDIIAGDWFMLALSIHSQRYLGLHIGFPNVSDRPLIKLLGGYDLGLLAGNAQALQIGLGRSGFRGQVGPLEIFSQKKLGKHLQAVLSDLVTRPLSLPADVNSSSVQLSIKKKTTPAGNFSNKITFGSGA